MIEYTLEFEEIEQLINASFDDPKMQLATDMCINSDVCRRITPD